MDGDEAQAEERLWRVVVGGVAAPSDSRAPGLSGLDGPGVFAGKVGAGPIAQLFVLLRQGDCTRWLKVGTSGEPALNPPGFAAAVLRAIESPEDGDTPSKGEVAHAHALVARAIGARRRGARAGPAPALRPDSVAARAVRMLQDSLAAFPSGPSPELAARADRILGLLRHAPAAGGDGALRAALLRLRRARRGLSAQDVVTELETALIHTRGRLPNRRGGAEEIVAVLLVGAG
jgi:hypothetical protein